MGANCSCFREPTTEDRRTNIEINRTSKASVQASVSFDASYPKGPEPADNLTLLTIIRIQCALRGYIARRKVRNPQSRAPFRMRGMKEISEDFLPRNNPAIAQAMDRHGSFVYDYTLNDGVLVTKRPAFEMEKGAIYTGEWNAQGQRHGKGRQLWVDGSVYEGYWAFDKATGKGRLFHADGDVYEGEWKNDKAHGQGVYTHSDGAKYSGGWDQDKQHGYGVEIWPDGARYEGSYKNGKKEGRGRFLWGDSSTSCTRFLSRNSKARCRSSFTRITSFSLMISGWVGVTRRDII